MGEQIPFNASGFFSALDTERQTRGLTWRQVAVAAGISQSTLSRLGQGKRPDVDSLAKLADWSHLSVDSFIARTEAASEVDTLDAISTYLRADRSLSPDTVEALETVVRATYNALKAR